MCSSLSLPVQDEWWIAAYNLYTGKFRLKEVFVDSLSASYMYIPIQEYSTVDPYTICCLFVTFRVSGLQEWDDVRVWLLDFYQLHCLSCSVLIIREDWPAKDNVATSKSRAADLKSRTHEILRLLLQQQLLLLLLQLGISPKLPVLLVHHAGSDFNLPCPPLCVTRAHHHAVCVHRSSLFLLPCVESQRITWEFDVSEITCNLNALQTTLHIVTCICWPF